MKRRKDEEERQRMERLRQEEDKKQSFVQKTEMTRKVEQSNHMEESRRLEELKIMERKRLEQQIYQESKVVSGQVAKRSDDVHGLGWGNVTTGFVSRKKLGFLQRSDSVERDFSAEGSPGPRGAGRGLRVTFAETPGSRPESAQSIDRAQQLRAQTPPLAGEWPVQQGANFSMQQSSTSASGMQQSSTSASAFGSASAGSTMFANQKSSSSKSSSFFSSSQQSSSQQSSSQQSSSQQSSSLQSSSMDASQSFEAFPGMGGIENLKL